MCIILYIIFLLLFYIIISNVLQIHTFLCWNDFRLTLCFRHGFPSSFALLVWCFCSWCEELLSVSKNNIRSHLMTHCYSTHLITLSAQALLDGICPAGNRELNLHMHLTHTPPKHCTSHDLDFVSLHLIELYDCDDLKIIIIYIYLH